MIKSHGYAAQTKTSALATFQFERRDVNVMEQRRETGLARPVGRVVNPNEMPVQGSPALRLDLRASVRAPQWSGPSLRPARCLRRHQRYYTPIRHPAEHRAGPPVSLGTVPLR